MYVFILIIMLLFEGKYASSTKLAKIGQMIDKKGELTRLAQKEDMEKAKLLGNALNTKFKENVVDTYLNLLLLQVDINEDGVY